MHYYSWDLSELYSPDIFEYDKYILNIQEVNHTIAEFKGELKLKKQIPVDLALGEDRVEKKQLRDFLYDAERKIIILIFANKICVFDQDSLVRHVDGNIKHLNIYIDDQNDISKARISSKDNPHKILFLQAKVDNFTKYLKSFRREMLYLSILKRFYHSGTYILRK